MISRRGFLTALTGLVAAPALLKAANAEIVPITICDQKNVAFGWSDAQILQKGDIFTIEGQYALNPRTLQPTGQLQQFIVTAGVSGVSLPVEAIHPPMVRAGVYQNVAGDDPVDPRWHTVPMRLIRPVGWLSTRGSLKAMPMRQRVAF